MQARLPIKSTTFKFFIEPLAQAIREETALEGIDVGSVENKKFLYADDFRPCHREILWL